MTSYASMKQKLLPLGLYSLSSGSEIDCELKAYAAGLDPLFDKLDLMEREAFIPTAETFGLTRREEFFGRERTDLSAQRRRKRLIAAERCMGDDATPDGFGVFLNSCGLEGIIVDENPNSRLITIYIGDTLSPGEKRLAVQKIAREIPAHLSARLIFACDDSTVDI